MLLAAAISSYLAIRASRAEIKRCGRLSRQSKPVTRKPGSGRRLKSNATVPSLPNRQRSSRKPGPRSPSPRPRRCWNSSRRRSSRRRRPKDQEGGLGIDATIRAAVDAAAKDIEKSLAGQPTVEGSIRDTLGQSYLYLSDPAAAIRHHERALALRRQALGPDHPDTLTSMSSLANAYWYAGRMADAVPLHEETLKLRQAKLGPDHLDTLESMSSLAVAYHDAGRLTEALPLYEESLKRLQTKHGFDHPDSLTYMNNLAGAYQAAGRLPEALPLFEAALKGRQAKLGLDHPDTLTVMTQLARLPRGQTRPGRTAASSSLGDPRQEVAGRLGEF